MMCRLKNQAAGFALTLTLIILALAAVTAVAFLTTVTTERANTATYARIAKAELFAEAGVDAAIARVTTEMQYRPYHAIGYRNIGTPTSPVIVPVIVGPRTTNPGAATYNMAPTATPDVYLLSIADPSGGGAPPGSKVPSGLDNTNSVDLNATRRADEPRGWIGSPTNAQNPIEYRAPWIDILRDPSLPPQPDSGSANYNPVIGRYAYWVEDETSKLDASIVGNKDQGGAFQRGDGVNLPANVPAKLAVNDLDVGALPFVNSSPLPAGDTTTNTSIIDLRSTLPLPDARFLNRAVPRVYETTKFYGTSFSLSNDLAGTGRRRANVNGLVTNTLDAATIAGNIDDIAYVITGTHLMPTQQSPSGTLGPAAPAGQRVFENAPTYSNTLTNFGARFFTKSTPTADQATMYVERIAANIRDYVDSDTLPTYINTSDQIVSGSKPSLAWKSGTEPRAVGKEAIPYLQETAWYGFERQMQDDPSSPPPGSTRVYDVDIDFYLEFLNPTNKDFIAPSGAFLKLYSRVGWDAGSYPPLQPLDFEFPIAGIKFPAGAATVITTSPSSANDPPGLILGGNVVRLTGGTRNFTGKTDHHVTGVSGQPIGLQMKGRGGSSGTTDYSTECVWGSPDGIYDAHAYIASGSSPNFWHFTGGADVGSKTRFVYSYGLRGNDDVSRTGDARSLSEQLTMLGGLASLGTDQTRFFGDIAGNGVIPQKTTLGRAASPYVDSTKWPDYTPPLADTPATGYAVVRDGAMQSIGELGNMYDPVRTKGTSTSPPADIKQARGGGRTLSVGQQDALAGTRFSSTWFNSAWRLADLFSADLSKDASGNYVKVSSPTSRGKINVNGILRDDGVAFRAALRSFTFLASPGSDPQLSGKTLSDAEADQLITEIKTYLANNGPFMERGEISQLTFFNSTGASKETAGGKTLDTVNDRGREEIFRRCVEMITTRSASFTVYVVGQAIRQDKSGVKRVDGEKRLAITFQLEPRKGNAALASAAPYDYAESYIAKKIYAPN